MTENVALGENHTSVEVASAKNVPTGMLEPGPFACEATVIPRRNGPSKIHNRSPANDSWSACSMQCHLNLGRSPTERYL